jgi:signal transduction histidine kinase
LLPQLFEPFARLNANIDVTEGAGIGLALTKKLIEMMNGKVGVTSQVNKGTTFWIELERI